MKDYITYLKFDDCSKEELLSNYKTDIANHRKAITVTPNLDDLRLTYKNEALRHRINSADYSTIDGKPILWLAKLTKKKNFKYKISGSDLTVDLLKLADENKYRIFIFGGKEGVAEKAKANIEKDYPNAIVAGTCCPDFGYEKDEEKSKRYIEEINAAQADIILLCTGFPKSENFYFDHIDEFNPGLYFTVGASVDFIAGNIKRAPKWMSKIGLEWLYRLSKDFRRLFKRYWLDGWFLLKIINVSIFNKKKILRLRK